MDEDRAYFALRSMQERTAAEKAIDPSSQEIHLELAARYERLAESQTATEAVEPFGELTAPPYVKVWKYW